MPLQVLKAEKKKILREHKEKLIFYHRRVEQVKENKAIKDMVSATFPALTEMSVVSSPELQFLMDSDKPPVEPELTPLLPEPRLEELLLQVGQSAQNQFQCEITQFRCCTPRDEGLWHPSFPDASARKR